MTAVTTERLFSADDHVDIGHDRIKAHLASKYHDDYDAALAAFRASMHLKPSTPSNATSIDPSRSNPRGLAGHRDPHQRLRDMDADGVWGSATYCEVSAYRYLYMLERGAEEATRAFNLTLAEFASVDPERLLVSYQIPIHDIDAAVREVEAVVADGGRSLQLPVYPHELDQAEYWDPRYDRLWSVIQEAGLPICCHIGQNSMLNPLARRDPTPNRAIMLPLLNMSTAEAYGMWIMGGVFERFPGLKVVFVEPGIGWGAWWLYIVDDMVQRQGYEFPAISELPSHYFHQNVFLTFIDEPDAVQQSRERLGVENLLWSSDYPHPVSSWPNSRAVVDDMFADVPDVERQLMVYGNAARVWNLP
jgi:predicted TIM-barrel fold metal-dependent hydrolase